MYRKGKLMPSLHPLSALSKCLNLLGTLLEKVLSANTLAANTGSVGARHALMMSAVVNLVRNTVYMKPAVTSQLNVMTGPNIMPTLFQCREKYDLGNCTPTVKHCRETTNLAVSCVISSVNHCEGLMRSRPRGPKAIPTRVASGGSERWRRLRMKAEKRA